MTPVLNLIMAILPDHILPCLFITGFTYMSLHSASEICDIPDTILPLLFGVLLLTNGLSCVNGRTALISLSTFTNHHQSHENKIEQLCISCISSNSSALLSLSAPKVSPQIIIYVLWLNYKITKRTIISHKSTRYKLWHRCNTHYRYSR